MAALNLNTSAVYALKNFPLLSFKPHRLCQSTLKIVCAMNMAANQSNNPNKLSISHIMVKARRLWDASPLPVKNFPWNKTLDNFIQLILDLVLAVMKYLSIPIFSITSVSEMSYCAHERKLFLVPLPFLVGVAAAGVLRKITLESSPYLKNAEVPWHLISVMTFFALIKFPGPYYPYWGRILIPNFANGVLLRTLWFMFQWYKKPQDTLEKSQSDSIVGFLEPESS